MDEQEQNNQERMWQQNLERIRAQESVDARLAQQQQDQAAIQQQEQEEFAANEQATSTATAEQKKQELSARAKDLKKKAASAEAFLGAGIMLSSVGSTLMSAFITIIGPILGAGIGALGAIIRFLGTSKQKKVLSEFPRLLAEAKKAGVPLNKISVTGFSPIILAGAAISSCMTVIALGLCFIAIFFGIMVGVVKGGCQYLPGC